MIRMLFVHFVFWLMSTVGGVPTWVLSMGGLGGVGGVPSLVHGLKFALGIGQKFLAFFLVFLRGSSFFLCFCASVKICFGVVHNFEEGRSFCSCPESAIPHINSENYSTIINVACKYLRQFLWYKLWYCCFSYMLS